MPHTFLFGKAFCFHNSNRASEVGQSSSWHENGISENKAFLKASKGSDISHNLVIVMKIQNLFMKYTFFQLLFGI